MKAVMYHYIREGMKSLPYFRYLSFKNFKRQLDYFEKKFGLVTYDEFYTFLEKPDTYNRIKDKVILTFDDGFSDHYEYVLPELNRRKTFGFFYIPTGVYNRKKALDVHRIHFLLGRYGGKFLIDTIQEKIESEMLIDKHRKEFMNFPYSDQDNDFYTQEFKKIFNYYISYDFRESILDTLVYQLSDEDEIFNKMYMTQDQLKELHKEGMVLGSHSVNHLIFSKLSDEEQYKEIQDSFSFLERLVGDLYIKSFCYPYGGFHTFTHKTEEILSQVGCRFSFNVEHRDIEKSDFEKRPQALSRYDCNYFLYGKASMGWKVS